MPGFEPGAAGCGSAMLTPKFYLQSYFPFLEISFVRDSKQKFLAQGQLWPKFVYWLFAATR